MANVQKHPVFNLGKSSAIPVGQGRCYLAAGKEIAVFRQRDGRLFASQNLCPHRQGPLAEGMVGGNKVICPLHGHQFDLETGAGGDGHGCLQVHDVQEIDSNIVLTLSGRQLMPA